MLTLEKIRAKQPEIRKINKGTKLLCYVGSHQFRMGNIYRIYDITPEYISVLDCDEIEVLFDTMEDLKQVFMIIDW